jgi:type II secretory pathway component PulJ
LARNAFSPTMPTLRSRQHGAILLESLIALAVLSLGAAAMFRAFDVLEATSHAASEYGAQALATLNQTEDR